MAYRRAPADEFEIHEESNDAKLWRECCTDPCVSLWTYNPCIATFFIIAIIFTVGVAVFAIPPAQTASNNAHDINDAIANSAYQSVGISVYYDPTLTWQNVPGAPCCNTFSMSLLAQYIGRGVASMCALSCPGSIAGSPCTYTNITNALIGLPVQPTQIILQQAISSCDGSLTSVCNGSPSCAQSFALPLDVSAWALPDPSVTYTPPCNQFSSGVFANAITAGLRSYCNYSVNAPGNASNCPFTTPPSTWIFNSVSPIEIILEPMIYTCTNLVGDVYLGQINGLNISGSYR